MAGRLTAIYDELTHEMICAEVSAHIHRLSGSVASDEDGRVTRIVHDGVFDAEDDAAMETCRPSGHPLGRARSSVYCAAQPMTPPCRDGSRSAEST